VANVVCVSDPRHAGLTAEQLTALAPRGPLRCMFVADRVALAHPEHPLLVVDLGDEPGRAFRATPSAVGYIEANLAIANTDFAEYADAVDADGIHRGFRRP
jgi:hypothetical protein